MHGFPCEQNVKREKMNYGNYLLGTSPTPVFSGLPLLSASVVLYTKPAPPKPTRKHDSIPPSDEMTSEGRLTLANWREFRICLLGIQISRPGHHGNRIVLAENYRFVDQ
jgi:hypothetical protein